MAGHSKFHNIQHRKNAQDAKKTKNFTKASAGIISAVKVGGGNDPDSNPRLRVAVNFAKAVGLPKDKIEKALNPSKDDHYDEVNYGIMIEEVALMVCCLTNNKNRTASELKAVLSKYGGSISSVDHIFKRMGIFILNKSSGFGYEIENIIEEVDAEDVFETPEEIRVLVAIENFAKTQSKLDEMRIEIGEMFVGYVPRYVHEKTERGERLIEKLDELDDVHRVFANTDC